MLLTICEEGAEEVSCLNADVLLKNRLVDDAPLDKRRKLGTGRIMTSTTSSRGTKALAPVTTNQKEVAAASSKAQKSLESLAMEKDNLRNMLDSSERNCVKAGFVKQREVAVKEVGILRGELQKVREDRERQLVLVQELTSELARFKENIGCTVAEVDKLSIKSSALEETCSSHRYQISILQHQLAANQKLKMTGDLSSSKIRNEYED
ncbi:hypothetical protein Tco_1215894 [Tanacetum coccineum]